MSKFIDMKLFHQKSESVFQKTECINTNLLHFFLKNINLKFSDLHFKILDILSFPNVMVSGCQTVGYNYEAGSNKA